MKYPAVQKTIRMKIILLAVIFTLVLTILPSVLSFVIFRDQARRSIIQSTEFNLQLIAGTAAQDLASIDRLSRWVVSNSAITSWLADEDSDPRNSLKTYNLLVEQVVNMTSSKFIRRLIVCDSEGKKLLQTGNNMSNSWPVNVYNIQELNLNSYTEASVYEFCGTDPFALRQDLDIIPLIRPVYHPSRSGIIGYVYIAVTTDIFLSLLSNYNLESGNILYIRFPDSILRVEENRLRDVTDRVRVKSELKEETLDNRTLVQEVLVDDGISSLMVTSPFPQEKIKLSQTLYRKEIAANWELVTPILLVIICSAGFFGIFISIWLNHLFTQPLLRIRRKVDEIADSDFSPDREIEWNNEIGYIGHGINEMAVKIQDLLESRVADEKKKRDLEYRMLLSQINPHFLYNTLNSIKWMATLQNAPGIAEMTVALSRLMKTVIKRKSMMIELREELSFLDDYFLIQQYRYGNAIIYRTDIPEELLSLPIPSFSLQPLMENAIFHGIEPKGGTGSITISASRKNTEDVEIILEDDGTGMTAGRIAEVLSDEEHQSGSGFFREIGVANINLRLQHSYGESYGLRLVSEPGNGTRAIIRLPYPEERKQII